MHAVCCVITRRFERFSLSRYQRLMVDEFQDTDPVQAEMMFLLTGA